jgi:agmatine/peptidylarginine deiminase
MHRSITEARDLALKETVKLLQKTVSQIDNKLPIVVRGPIRIMLLNKIADIWVEDLGQILNVEPILRDLNNYAFNSWLFDYKLAEAINLISSFSSENTTKQKQNLFSLN